MDARLVEDIVLVAPQLLHPSSLSTIEFGLVLQPLQTLMIGVDGAL